MPNRAPRLCGCCGLLIAHGAQCPNARARDAERKARYDRTRLSSSARGYNRGWESARKRFLYEHPRCAKCSAPSTVVDHKIPHRGDASLFWERSNWQALCEHCHNSLKQKEERRGTR